MVNKAGDCFSQTFTLSGPGKGNISDLPVLRQQYILIQAIEAWMESMWGKIAED